jgi:tetratricopeptide (TPR) repeat protein
MGRVLEAIKLLEAAIELNEKKLGADHPNTLHSRNGLAVAYRSAGRLTEAVMLFEANLRIMEKKLGRDHPNTLKSRNSLAEAYVASGCFDRAEPLCRDNMQLVRKKRGSDDPLAADSMDLLGQSLLTRKKWSEAEPILRECLEIRAKTQPDAWTTLHTRSLLGASLLGQTKYPEAEPLIVSGYEGMKSREAKMPAQGKPRLIEAAERLLRLYEAWGKPDQAAAWRARLGLAYLDETMPNGAAAFARRAEQGASSP